MRGCLPFIQHLCRHRHLSFYPPAWTGRPLVVFAGLHELSAPGMYSTNVTIGLVGSYSTFSPLLWRAERLFSSTSTDPCEPLSVRKRGTLCCPDFPLAQICLGDIWASGRPACCLISAAKVQIKSIILLLADGNSFPCEVCSLQPARMTLLKRQAGVK